MQAIRGCTSRGDALFQASFDTRKFTRSTNARQVRLSTLRYSRAKICGLLRDATLKSHNVMPASISFQRSSFRSSTSDRNVSAPGGARLQFGAEAAGNKKTRRRAPGDSALRRGCSMSRLQDRLARCSNSFYPVLVTNFTSWADLVRQENPRQTRGHRHQKSISRILISSSIYKLFSRVFSV